MYYLDVARIKGRKVIPFKGKTAFASLSKARAALIRLSENGLYVSSYIYNKPSLDKGSIVGYMTQPSKYGKDWVWHEYIDNRPILYGVYKNGNKKGKVW